MQRVSDSISRSLLNAELFRIRYNPNHVLHCLLPQPKNIGYNLCERTHNLTLPTDGIAVINQNSVYIQNVIQRYLLTVFFYVLLLFCIHCLLLFE